LSFAIDGLIEITGLEAYSRLGDFERSLAGLRGGSLLLAFGVFGVAAGVGEELLCRGWLQRGLQARFGATAAIVVSSLIFGALHLEPVHAVAAGLLGVYLGCVAWLADSVRASIACHIANNATAVAVAVAAADWPLPATTPAAIAGAAIVAVGTLAWAVRRIGAPRPRSPAPDEPPNNGTGGPPDPVSLQPDAGSADA
jgi:membrane protease YdiL (CAAX protease family)